MGIGFAEGILDSMVDENGHCGERGLSKKQFNVLSKTLEPTEWRYESEWEGDFSTVEFYSRDWEGDVGKYHVVLNEFRHFNDRFSVVSIDLRPSDEVEADRRLQELAKFAHSEWMYEPKDRVDLSLVLVREYRYVRMAYSYGTESASIYTLADDDGNCFVWKSAKVLEWVKSKEGVWDYEVAEPGDRITMRATIKAHGEWNGIKQTVILRPKVSKIEHGALFHDK